MYSTEPSVGLVVPKESHRPDSQKSSCRLGDPDLTTYRFSSRQEGDSHLFDGSRAALVSIEQEEDGILFAEYLNLVTVVREGTGHHKFPRHPWTTGELEHGSREPCQAEWMKSETDWCLI